MAIECVVTPKLSPGDLNLLSRLRGEFDRFMEGQEALDTEKQITRLGQTITALGTHLWEALISGMNGGLKALETAREEALAEGTVVRLVIQSDDPQVQALPWELVFHADERYRFLGRNSDFTLMRRLKKPDSRAFPLPGRPLKILLFIASPEDLNPEQARLDFETEEAFLFSALDEDISRGAVEIDVAEDGTLETLKERLSRQTYHVVHLSMHGLADDQRTVLLFEDRETGLRREVSPQELIEVWKAGNHRAPCLFLSACRTAQPDTYRAVPDFARALIEAGVPHVIGMRRSVADRAATHFAGHFYQSLAVGKPVDEALTQARRELPEDDPTFQWSIPVLYSRKADLTVIDEQKPFTPLPRPQIREVQIGELLIRREGFIGRRAAIRKFYRNWKKGNTPHLLLYGIGGVGKTALAGYFALRWQRERPDLHIFAFTPPFEALSIEEQLRRVFGQYADPQTVETLQRLESAEDRLQQMLTVLKNASCVFIFDNLETCLDLKTRRFLPEYREVETRLAGFLRQAGPNFRTLFTCRYPVVSRALSPPVVAAELPDAPPGDILRFMAEFNWPGVLTSEQKQEIYRTLGGNFRAIEWLSALLGQADHSWPDLRKHLEQVKAKMRRNLIFDRLFNLLPPEEQRLLQRLCLETHPITVDGVQALWDGKTSVEAAVQRLVNYRLVETGESPHHDLPTYRVPPLVAELTAPLPPEQQREAHARLGRYWKFVGEHFTRLITDDLRAYEHFCAAGLTQEADAMLEGLSRHYYARQMYGQVVKWLAPLVQRKGEQAPWWALTRLGQCLHVLGRGEAALRYFQQAYRLVQSPRTTEEKENLGTTLNNISQIYDARGDYEQALNYLRQSLTIQREIG
ncbi:MAG: CHAT domain-containing protein, partial [Calditrichaeota bacterium]